VFPLTRLIEFSCGVALGKFLPPVKQWQPEALLVMTTMELFAVAMVLGVSYFSDHVQKALYPLIGGPLAFWFSNCGVCIFSWMFLICCFAQEQGLFSRLLQQPVFVYLGEISFTIYMMHGVLLTWLGVYAPQCNGPLNALAFLGVLLLVSHLMSFHFERPMRAFVIEAI